MLTAEHAARYGQCSRPRIIYHVSQHSLSAQERHFPTSYIVLPGYLFRSLKFPDQFQLIIPQSIISKLSFAFSKLPHPVLTTLLVASYMLYLLKPAFHVSSVKSQVKVLNVIQCAETELTINILYEASHARPSITCSPHPRIRRRAFHRLLS